MNLSDLTVRFLDITDIPLLLDLQEAVFDRLENPDFLRKNTCDTFEFCFRRPHFIPGVFAGKDLIAVSIFVDAAGTEEDLRPCLRNYTCIRPIQWKLVLVHPNHRGFGLQLSLFRLCKNLILDHGYTEILATVDPENRHSYDNVIRIGMKEDHREIKYGGLYRAVMILHLNTGDSPMPAQNKY